MLKASIFIYILKKYINERVQLLHFSSDFPTCSSCFSLRFWMLGLNLICAIFDNVLLFLLRRTRTLRAHNLLFYIVNEIYEYYKAQSAIGLFQMNELFSHYFRGFKLEIFDPRNSHNPIRFSSF